MVRSMITFLGCLILMGCSSIPSIQKDQSLSEYLNSINFSGAVLVSRNNEIIHSAGYGFSDQAKHILNTPDTQFHIGSLTKQFTALAIMQLQDKGLLNINDPISKYLPDFPNASQITIKNLLSHSAGLYDFTDDWDEIKRTNISTADIVKCFKDRPLKFEPGSKVEYSSSGYILAGLIIEKVSGMNYEKYIESQIFKPLKMSHSSYGYYAGNSFIKAIGYKDHVPQDSININITYAAGALASTVSDFYLWDQSFYSSPLVSSGSLSEIYPADRGALGVGFGTGKFKVVMGLGWGIYESKFGPEYSHVGNVDGFSTVVSRYPTQRATIIIFSNQDRFDVFTLKNRIANRVLASGKT